MTSILIITKIVDGIPTCTTVTVWVGAGTAIIPGMIPGTILGITDTDITTDGTVLGTTVAGIHPGITVAGTALGTTAAGTHPGITEVTIIPGMAATAAGTVEDITAVSTMDITQV